MTMEKVADFNPALLILEKTKEIQVLQQQYRYLLSAFNETCSRLPISSPLSLSPPSMSPRNSVSPTQSERKTEMTSEKTFTTLRDVFQQYATVQTLTMLDRMELAQFHKFLSDSRLVPDFTTRVQADVAFFNKNRGKNITFSRWVAILSELIQTKYPAEARSAALDRFVEETLCTSSALQAKLQPGINLREVMSSPDLQMELSKATPLFDYIYATFSSRETKCLGMMPLLDFMTMATHCHIVPELLTKRDLVRAFTMSQMDAFSELMSKEEFACAVVCLAMLAFPKRSGADAVALLADWVEPSIEDIKKWVQNRGRLSAR